MECGSEASTLKGCERSEGVWDADACEEKQVLGEKPRVGPDTALILHAGTRKAQRHLLH